MINNQKPMAPIGHKRDGALLVHSIFYTIQGEGPFSGQPAVFVRLNGCNLQCPLCDTEYTDKGVWYTAANLLDAVMDEWPLQHRQVDKPLIVLTGGEPFRQEIGAFLALVFESSIYHVQIETNGTLWKAIPTHNMTRLTIVVSPKSHIVHEKIALWAGAWKYVGKAADIESSEDGLPNTALDHPVKEGRKLYRPQDDYDNVNIYLSPADQQDTELNLANRTAVVKSCLKYGYSVSLQTHKLLGVE